MQDNGVFLGVGWHIREYLEEAVVKLSGSEGALDGHTVHLQVLWDTRYLGVLAEGLERDLDGLGVLIASPRAHVADKLAIFALEGLELEHSRGADVALVVSEVDMSEVMCLRQHPRRVDQNSRLILIVYLHVLRFLELNGSNRLLTVNFQLESVPRIANPIHLPVNRVVDHSTKIILILGQMLLNSVLGLLILLLEGGYLQPELSYFPMLHTVFGGQLDITVLDRIISHP